jgi:hypothetical protein
MQALKIFSILADAQKFSKTYAIVEGFLVN